MLNIHAISYHNIGPFGNKMMSVFFVGGKYLIKAPIGSGKSFLFFDGPLYGLYKHAERRMLNVDHQSGFIKIIFSIHDTYYLIIRSLKQAKSKESCSSQQFIIHDVDKLIPLLENKDIVVENTDIHDLLIKNSIRLEEIVYKNETDLQQTLTTLLPPREVFTSTMFLLQESQNIFELTPADRIEILKNVFDLMSIDSAKDRIAEKKREVQLQKKILGDTQHQDAKLRINIQSFIAAYHTLTQDSQRSSLKSYSALIHEREHIVEKITLQDCDIPRQAGPILVSVQETLATVQERYHNYTQQVDTLQSSIKKTEEKIQQIQQEIQTATHRKKSIEEEIHKSNIPDESSIKTSITSYVTQQQALEKKVDPRVYASIIDTIDLSVAPSNNTLLFAYQTIQACMQAGKNLAQEKNYQEEQQKSLQERYDDYQKQLADLELKPDTETYRALQKQIEREKESLDKDKNNLLLQQKNHESKLEEIDTAIQKIQERIEAITTDNPDIKECVDELQQALAISDTKSVQHMHTIISKYLGDKQIAQLHKELQAVQEQRRTLNHVEQIEAIAKKLQAIDAQRLQLEEDPSTLLHEFFAGLEQKRQSLSAAIQSLDYDSKHKTYSDSIAHIQERINSIKDFLQANERKEIESLYTQRQDMDTAKKEEEKKLQAIEGLLQKQQEQKQQIQALTGQIQQRENDIQSLQKEIDEEKNKLQSYIDSNPRITKESMHIREQESKMIEKSLHTISELVTDHTSNQQKLTALLQDEKVLNNLYTIVSKELLLLVLGESLSFLTDIINVYLAQVLSLQLHLEIQKTSGDKVELAAYCEDEKGRREVKSLSGGQKTILKLVWMLAIASYLRAPMLFLDETINNIDKDTVGKVADMLTDFVKKNDMKLYTITHSEQIQSMNIWDGIISVGDTDKDII